MIWGPVLSLILSLSLSSILSSNVVFILIVSDFACARALAACKTLGILASMPEAEIIACAARRPNR